MTPAEARAAMDGLFASEAVFDVPTVEDRYRYKKVGGSSDTKHTSDEFN